MNYIVTISDDDDECDECGGYPGDAAAWERVALDLHHRAWCDAWLAIGLAAAYVDTRHSSPYPEVEERVRVALASWVGRVVRRRGGG